jgi:hypothetical protein
VQVCLKGEAAFAYWRQWRWEVQRLDDIDDDETVLLSPSLGSLVMLVLNAANIGALVLAEQSKMAAGSATNIGHAAHLTGFAWGVGFFAVRAAWRKWGRSLGGPVARAGRGGGHVLGRGGAATGGRRLGGAR